MYVAFIELNVGDEFVYYGDHYKKSSDDEASRIGDGEVFEFLPEDEVQDA